MIVEVGSALQGRISKCMESKGSAVFIPALRLTNGNGYNYTARYIKGIIIQNKFTDSYMTQYQVKFRPTIEERRELLKNMKDLEAELILKPVDPMTGKEVYEGVEEIQLKLRVVVDDQKDMDKTQNPNQFGRTDTTNDGTVQIQTQSQAEAMEDVELSLVEPEAYDLRHVQMNAMFNAVKLEDVMQWAAQQFKLSEVNISEPDNKTEFDNLIIPPGMDISNLFPFLQERHGVYSKGMGYYVSHNALYAFPLYSHDRSTSTEKGVVHIVNAPPNYNMGGSKYHDNEDDDLYIISTSPKASKPLATAGLENVGNTHYSVNADETRDKAVTIHEDGKVEINGNNISSVSAANEAGSMASDAQSTKFCGERQDVYTSSSQMAAVDGTTLTAGWSHAVPDLIKPGHPITYHFEKQQGEYNTQDGIVTEVVYTGNTVSAKDASNPWIVFDAVITAHLTADQQGEDVVQYANAQPSDELKMLDRMLTEDSAWT